MECNLFESEYPRCCCSVAQLCLILHDPIDCSTPGFPVLHHLQSLLNMSIESVMPSNHLILCHPLLLPSIFPASGSFLMSRFFASSGQSTGAATSASFLPVNIQGWFPLGLIQVVVVNLNSMPCSCCWHCFADSTMVVTYMTTLLNV